ncbi:MAG: RHS repeat-associated core domain-containing protein [Fibrobacter sp.]|uniref:RHS repeat-associated core domain-containing protein n=1 Tax=Fibrobacter sp. TaxID=35828 RepID=UPI0025C34135|nr:RHS repeat-associated core domain-containing protein [Fibrobacter sp.]MBQ9225814.1 RHS repeat-associated core domain-containing protein [Fibrobacter sp.]
MPIEFTQYPPQENTGVSGDTLFRLTVAYDGTGRRISKTRWVKAQGDAGWSRGHVTHYTGIGTEVRENLVNNETKVVVNMPQGLGRYGIEDADHVAENGSAQTFEWYLKNHLGSTMLVYGTAAYDDSYFSNFEGGVKAAYDYRAFGEQVTLAETADKVTENFTGKELDDETQLDYFGARYLDPMLGMWISVDPARQFSSPYLYAGNGYNPVNAIDPDGNETKLSVDENGKIMKGMNRVDDGNNVVTVTFADGKTKTFAEPPLDSYFFTEDLTNQMFDPDMQKNVEELLDDAYDLWPADFPFWYSGFSFDFKYAYYKGAENTVGSLKGTIMTARDVGNAIWGGWARHMYTLSRPTMEKISDFIAGGKEDAPSAVMQRWGYDNYKP